MNSTQQLSFANSHLHIGIDVHLKNWKVTIRMNKMELKTFSMNPSAAELLAYLQHHYPNGIYHIVYEAGFCGFGTQRFFQLHNFDCRVVNPADVPTTNKEKVNKNDPVDSRKLARALENNELCGIYIPTIEQEELRMLMRLRYHLIQQQTRTKNRIKSLLYSQGILIPIQFSGRARWSHNFILWLQSIRMHTPAGNFTLQNLILQLQQIREHNKNIIKHLRTEAKKKNIAPILSALDSVPGIAFLSAMYLFTELISMNRFPNEDHLCAYVGLVPATQSSDETVYLNKISSRKNKFLRPILIEIAWTAVRSDPAMTLKYHQLTKHRKPQDAIIRIAKKLLRRIRHVWIQQEQYVFALVA